MFLLNLLGLVGYCSIFLVIPIIFYGLFSKQHNLDLLCSIKYLLTLHATKQLQTKKRKQIENKTFENLEEVGNVKPYVSVINHSIDNNIDLQTLSGIDQKGNYLRLDFTFYPNGEAKTNLSLRVAQSNTVYTLQDTQLCRINKWQWKTKNLLIEVLEPFRNLRVVFNGLLLDNTLRTTEHVQFSFKFSAASAPKWYPQDVSHSLLAAGLAQTRWKDGQWANLLDFGTNYEQFGAFFGSVKTPNIESVLNLPGCRSRYQGLNNAVWTRSLHLLIADESGTLLNINVKQHIRHDLFIKSGFVILNNGSKLPITDTDINLENIAPHRDVPGLLNIYVKTSEKDFHCVLHITNQIQATSSILVQAECDLNTKQAHALLNLWYNHGKENEVDLMTTVIPKIKQKKSNDLIVNLNDEKAKLVELTGGKGASLAELTTLGSELFLIPEGFVVTTNAFDHQLIGSPIIREVISTLVNICSGKTSGDLEQSCECTVNIIKNQKIDSTILEAVTQEFWRLNKPGDRWAVRSSAIGEDSEELSAAGQNETILGCRNEQDVLRSLTACWASLFTHQSVQYRRQHGLEVQSKMAIVVQKMVPSDSSGVLFTCHPATGNPNHMVITSNFGLGESVVSGHIEPDTIILDCQSDKLIVLDKQKGSKEKIVQMTDDGTQLIDFKEDKISLTDEQALELGKLGTELEKIFKIAVDVEFAFYQNQLYLLQMRPVTTLHSYSDFELVHEFDTPVLSDKISVFTKANTGEVFPGCCSVLTQSTIVRYIDRGYQLRTHHTINKFKDLCITIFQHQTFLDVLNGIIRVPAKNGPTFQDKVVGLAVFGHEAITAELNNIALEHHGVRNPLAAVVGLLEMLKVAWNNEKFLKKMLELNRSFEIDIQETDSVQEIYNKINECDHELMTITHYHTCTTGSSVFYQIMALSILLEGNQEFNEEHYSDIGILLSSCGDVISAQIPIMLENIADELRKSAAAKTFLEVETNKGIEWLKQNSPIAYQLFETFLKTYGHRSLGEMDLKCETWSMNPNLVIEMIKANCKGQAKLKKEQLSVEEIVEKLVSPKKSLTKKILKFILKKARIAVGIREQTKSEMVLAFHKLRIAYRTLAEHMVQNGLLPDKELIFHLSHHEVGQIIKHNSQVVIKATRRRKLYKEWYMQKFPEINIGIPKAIEEGYEQPTKDSAKLCRGTPVCQGSVKARACVINSLDEIDQLQEGDILITYSTDIAWSPYFPIISGIITELGGLISHGAVVAREYGLPSLVGVQGAMKIFKTGDIVFISGKNGTIELVE